MSGTATTIVLIGFLVVSDIVVYSPAIVFKVFRYAFLPIGGFSDSVTFLFVSFFRLFIC